MQPPGGKVKCDTDRYVVCVEDYLGVRHLSTFSDIYQLSTAAVTRGQPLLNPRATVPEASNFGLAIHPNDHQARRRFVELAQNEIAVVPDFHKRILFIDEAHFWLNGYVNKQNCRIWSEANPQVYVETPLHPVKLTVCCALWAGGILLQKR
ncbi:putative transposable element [Trichonephila clavipes]|nr:putative transposable element [Trichonephila clavipes]